MRTTSFGAFALVIGLGLVLTQPASAETLNCPEGTSRLIIGATVRCVADPVDKKPRVPRDITPSGISGRSGSGGHDNIRTVPAN